MCTDEQIYVDEKERQDKAGMPACRCSNCEPESCKLLFSKGKWLNVCNFDIALDNPECLIHVEEERSIEDSSRLDRDEVDDPDEPIVNQKEKGPPNRRIGLMPLAELLVKTFEEHHENLMKHEDRLKASDYLDIDDIWRILNKIYTIQTETDLLDILGCDILPGGVFKLFNCIKAWKDDSVGVQAMAELRAREAVTRVRQAETLTRLQRQHDDRAAKIQEERTRKENKRKQQQDNQVAGSLAKRHRKEEKEKKKKAQEESNKKRNEERARNVRMMASLHAAQTM